MLIAFLDLLDKMGHAFTYIYLLIHGSYISGTTCVILAYIFEAGVIT